MTKFLEIDEVIQTLLHLTMLTFELESNNIDDCYHFEQDFVDVEKLSKKIDHNFPYQLLNQNLLFYQINVKLMVPDVDMNL